MNFLPDFVKDDPEYLSLVEDLFVHDNLIAMDQIVHHYHSTRLRHSFYVSYISYKLAKNRQLDYESVARAGLLHDFFLEDRQEIKAMKAGSHSSVHPKIALKNARKVTTLSELEEDIILSHMYMTCLDSPRPHYKESWLVSMVDKYCAIAEFCTPVQDIVRQAHHKMRQWLVIQ